MPRVAIPIGDPAGIGPEISIKAALDPAVVAMCEPTLIGDRHALEFHARCAGLSLSGIHIKERSHFNRDELKVGEIRAAHGRAALDSAEAAIRGAMAGEFDAVVAAPHTESAVHAAGIEFDGYPSFVARVAGLAPEDGTLMLCFEHHGREIRIAHVTLHLSVARALEMITGERIRRTIEAVDATLKKIGIDKPRILVSGINPHAGEGGLFGDEEIRIVAPAISTTRRAAGIDADGPIGADTMLQTAGYEAYVVMLHDQGHIPAKALAPNRVAGLTIGTPVLFSSVAHGSALDIAGQGRAQHGAMVEAITRLVGRRRRAPETRA